MCCAVLPCRVVDQRGSCRRLLPLVVAALAVAAAVAVIMSVSVIATDGTVTAWCVAFFPVAVVLAGR